MKRKIVIKIDVSIETSRNSFMMSLLFLPFSAKNKYLYKYRDTVPHLGAFAPELPNNLDTKIAES